MSSLDFGFRHAQKIVIGKFRIVGSQRKAGDDLFFKQAFVGGLKAVGNSTTNSLKVGLSKGMANPAFSSSAFEILGLVMVETGQFPYPRAPHRGHIHGCRQGTKAVVGADVGRGFFPTDMLFPGGKGQHKASFSVQVFGLPDQATRQASHVFLFACKHSQRRVRQRTGEYRGFDLLRIRCRRLDSRGFSKVRKPRASVKETTKRAFLS